MNWLTSASRVLQGVGLVAEQAVRISQPQAKYAADRVLKHSTEVAQVIPSVISQVQQQAANAARSASRTPPPSSSVLVEEDVFTRGQSEDSTSPAQPIGIDFELEVPAQALEWGREDVPVNPALDTKVALKTAGPDATQKTAPVVFEAPTAPSGTLAKENDGSVVRPSVQPLPPPKAEEPAPTPRIKLDKQETFQASTPSPATFSSPPVGGLENVAGLREPTIRPKPRNVKPVRMQWNETHVPSTPLERVLGFGTLAAKLVAGTVSESIKNIGKEGGSPVRSALASDANAEALAKTLCEMRGAALKLGQLLSIQDESILPPTLRVALERVRQGADVMPKAQLFEMLATELGDDWRKNFRDFEERPLAAASIGQVHRAVLEDGREVALKVQYPGVANSIDSDLKNLKRLFTYTNLLPKGLYVDEIIRVGREELKAECDYEREAANQVRYRDLIQDAHFSSAVNVPQVIPELTTKKVLTTELVDGESIDKCDSLSQEERNRIARTVLEVTIKELFHWRFMQTDPNWGNFLYCPESKVLSLIDFGAARDYSKDFVEEYLKIVWGAAERDTKMLMESSIKLGFLTGDESPTMKRAHELAGLVVGEPFRSHQPFDFSGSRMVTRLAEYGEIFMKDRLTPPPQEAYSLHRKLSGAYLACIKLKAVVSCRDVLEEVWEEYQASSQ